MHSKVPPLYYLPSPLSFFISSSPISFLCYILYLVVFFPKHSLTRPFSHKEARERSLWPHIWPLHRWLLCQMKVHLVTSSVISLVSVPVSNLYYLNIRFSKIFCINITQSLLETSFFPNLGNHRLYLSKILRMIYLFCMWKCRKNYLEHSERIWKKIVCARLPPGTCYAG